MYDRIQVYAFFLNIQYLINLIKFNVQKLYALLHDTSTLNFLILFTYLEVTSNTFYKHINFIAILSHFLGELFQLVLQISTFCNVYIVSQFYLIHFADDLSIVNVIRMIVLQRNLRTSLLTLHHY